jgi:hypothetical protein
MDLTKGLQSLFQGTDNALAILTGNRFHPPGIYVVCGTVFKIVCQAKGPAQREPTTITAGREGLQAGLGIFRNQLRTLQLAQSRFSLASLLLCTSVPQFLRIQEVVWRQIIVGFLVLFHTTNPDF